MLQTVRGFLDEGRKGKIAIIRNAALKKELIWKKIGAEDKGKEFLLSEKRAFRILAARDTCEGLTGERGGQGTRAPIMSGKPGEIPDTEKGTSQESMEKLSLHIQHAGSSQEKNALHPQRRFWGFKSRGIK